MIQFQPILANLRHFAPPYTYMAPIQTLCPNFFHKINFPCQSVLSFPISFFGDIFEIRRPNLIFFLIDDTFYPICPPTKLFCFYFSPNSRRIFPMDKIYVFCQNPSLILIFLHKQVQIGTLGTHRKQKKSWVILVYFIIVQPGVMYV